MKFSPVFILLFFVHIYVVAQPQNNPQIDRLLTFTDTLLENGKIDSVEILASQTLKLSQENNYKHGIARSYLSLGILENKSGNWGLSNEYFYNALNNWNADEDSFYIAVTYRDLADMKANEGYLESALKYGNFSLTLFENLKNEPQVNHSKITLANIFQNMGNYEQAKNYYKEAEAFFSKSNDTETVAVVWFGTGKVCFDDGLYNEAKEFFNKAKSVFELNNDNNRISQTLCALGTVAMESASYSEANKYYNESLEIAQNINDSLLMFDVYIHLSELAYYQQNYNKALHYYKTAKELTENNLGLADRVYLEELNEDIYEFGIEVEKYRFQLFLSIAIILTILLIFGWFLHKKIQKTKSLELEKKESDAQRQYDQLLLQIFNQSLGEEREEKRRHYAKILHDKVGSQLAATRWLFEEVIHSHKNDKLEGEALTNVEKVLNGSYNSLRKIIKALEVEANDWLKEIREFCEVVSTSRNIDLNLETQGMIQTLSPGTGNKISGMVFNMVANVLLHANATKIDIQITQIEEEINIIVEDNGDGFDTNQKTSGKGLRHIKGDAERLGGTCQIDSVKGRGTTIVINIPADCT